MTSHEKGVYAEQLAARFLTNVQNATILEHRYKTYCGEVDLIVIDPQKILIAVEIKQRKTIDDARYAITPHQQKRIIKSMEVFLCRNPTIDYDGMRFDAILFNRDLSERLYMKNAWIPI
jgi:putative endonuclease